MRLLLVSPHLPPVANAQPFAETQPVQIDQRLTYSPGPRRPRGTLAASQEELRHHRLVLQLKPCKFPASPLDRTVAQNRSPHLEAEVLPNSLLDNASPRSH